MHDAKHVTRNPLPLESMDPRILEPYDHSLYEPIVCLIRSQIITNP